MVETLPRSYTMEIMHKETKNKWAYGMLNDISSSTQSDIYIDNILPGEYIYKMIVGNRVYETGILKCPDITPPVVKEYSNTAIPKYKSYGE